MLTVRWLNSALIYTSADPGWCCKNPVNFSLPFQIYVNTFTAFTGSCNIYCFIFQKSRLLLRMLPTRSLNQFQSTQLKRSERTTGYGERWLLENKNKELIWKSLNLTKRSYHMEVGKFRIYFLHWCKNDYLLSIIYFWYSSVITLAGGERVYFSAMAEINLAFNSVWQWLIYILNTKQFQERQINWHACVSNNLVIVG